MNCNTTTFLTRIFLSLIILSWGVQHIQSQNTQVYSVRPISFGVFGGLNLSYLDQGVNNELSTAKLPMGGVNVSFTTKNRFETRLETMVLNSGYNVESPFTKVRLLFLTFQLSEYYTFLNFMKVGIGISNNQPFYGSKKYSNGTFLKFSETNQYNAILSCNLLLNQNYSISVQYAKVLMKEKYNFLQMGFILWLIKSQNER